MFRLEALIDVKHLLSKRGEVKSEGPMEVAIN